jgi:D-threo-aldose 1-dehydrogenase
VGAVKTFAANDWMRTLGTTGIETSAIMAGGSSFDGARGPIQAEAGEEGIEPIVGVLASPIRMIDTSAAYGAGESERRIGAAIRKIGGLPTDFTVATKVAGRPGRFSGADVCRSIAESKQRLGLTELPLVYLHDPEFHPHDDIVAPGGPLDALVALRDAGQIGHLGIAGGYLPELHSYLDTGEFEVLLVHNRWTLVDRSAEALIDRAVGAGIAVVNAAVYGGGILAVAQHDEARYGYRRANAQTVAAVESMRQACARSGIALAVAALQFSLKDQRVSATVVGISRTARITSTLDGAGTLIPNDLWAELQTLVPGPEFWLDAGARS